MSNHTYVSTTATEKIFKMKGNIRAVAGGTSASKTISILFWLIDYCQCKHKTEKLVTVVSESYPHLSNGAMLDFINILKDRGYYVDERWNKTNHIYTFETENKIQFFSADTYGKAHGPRRDVLFLNECNNLDYTIVDQLIVRTREVVWMDWNPSREFWFYEKMLGKINNMEFITLTYKDNEALDTTTIERIESHKNDRQWWRVYGEGQLGQAENNIYKDWKIIDEVPHEARLERYGLDFGYTNDPTAIDAIYSYNGGYIIDEILHQKGLSNKQIADNFINIHKALVIADSAEPKSIDEIKSYGINILPSVKGQGTINKGIQYVQSKQISITKRSLNTIKEYRNYQWMVDKDGKVLNEPAGGFDHHMDAIRYAINSLNNYNYNSYINLPKFRPHDSIIGI